MPSIKVKKGGVYADTVGIFAKKAGVYSAVAGVFAKSAGAYSQVNATPAQQVAALFSAGEQGSWITPYDLPDLAQNSAGSVPFTAFEQRAGRVADKSPRGNPALQTTPANRPSVTSRWNLLANAAWVGGPPPTEWSNVVGTGTSVPNGTVGGNTVYRQTAVAQRPFIAPTASVPVPAGAPGTLLHTYRVKAVYSGTLQLLNAIALVGFGTGATITFTINGVTSSSVSLVAAGDEIGFRVTSGSTVGGVFARDGVGVSAAGTGDFDMYRAITDFDGGASPGRPLKFSFDGGSDALVTTFPGALGSNCTVGIAVPNVGAKILTGQTIGTTYTDSETHSGRIVINRGLTTPETASLRTYLNQLSGVSEAYSSLSALKRAIRANAGDVNILVLGDSTGNESTEWVVLLSRWLGVEYQTHSVSYRLWDDASNVYGAATVPIVGSGANIIRVWNCSVGGTASNYFMAGTNPAKWAAGVTALPSIDLVMWNYGHNQLGQPASVFLGPIDEVRAAYPTTPAVVTIQNPWRDDDSYAPTAAILAAIPSQRAFVSTVDVYSAYLALGKPSNLYVDVVHPSISGSRVWRDVVALAIRTAIAN
jgi:hypothetical protein